MTTVRHGCQLGIAASVLVLELITGQLCRSFVLLVDGFHTFFVLSHMTLPRPSSSPSPSGSSDPAKPTWCGASHPDCRRRPLGVFVSALLLFSLCVSCLLEMIASSVEMHAVVRPWLLVAVGGVSLLCKVTALGMTRGSKAAGAGVPARGDVECFIEINHKAVSQGASGVVGEAERGPREASGAQHGTAVHSLHNGGLVFCNPATSEGGGGDAQESVEEPKPAREELNVNGKSRTLCPASVVVAVQGLSTSVLVLVTGLVLLLVDPHYRYSPGLCSLLVYLDPSLAILAVIILVVRAVPQMHRYGLLLMQATPPHVSLSDLRERIGSVPGVEEVHELHIWELSDSLVVASVHVLCQAAFPLHRCADLMSGITNVLQSVGASCCTVQPEFAPPCALPGAPASPSAAPACRLACPKLCDAHVCCPQPRDLVMETL
ncbi:proton-coupled zinc antiporter SLC30A1 [Syngnathoides biaculeatus]|uniref:proton-coupled zinc antiporter SLC30A1 n=1 Tax=Syngnathoides biaculeatus TaxID=300417 RepID=UPI002ADD7077|nr:proton-coupled zinc antiporter SLC30A1 [Syngnathoides biaculeatus]